MSDINITGDSVNINGDVVHGDKHVHLPPAPPRDFVAPFQALADLQTFVGRAEHLQTLAGLGAIGVMPPRFLIAGIGGLGKTTLAIHVAHQLKNVFDGGVLWADVPTTEPFNKLDEWARLYGGDLREVQEINARADALRNVLQTHARNKRVLAILGGVVDESDDAKIFPLLRALSDCAVLVTSRATNLASFYHLRQIPLDKFDEHEAEKLFQNFLPNDARLAGNEKQIHALGAAVDWLPFALELLVKQLSKHREWTLADLQNKLAQSKLDALKWNIGQGQEIGIRASFRLSYRGLTQDEQTFFNRLGAFGGQDFDVRAADYVAGKQRDTETGNDTERRLEHLLELSMAQTGRGAGRFTLHALMREFAREQCGAELYDAELRMATYYCEIAKFFGPRLHGGEGLKEADAMNALGMLEREVSNLFAGQKWARENETREARQVTRDFVYGATIHYFQLRANWAEWIEWSEFGIAACQALEDERGEGAIAGNLGNVYADKGEWDKAIEFYQKSLDTLERVGDVHGMAQTFNNLGYLYQAQGDLTRALEYAQKALEIFKKLGAYETAQAERLVEQLKKEINHKQ